MQFRQLGKEGPRIPVIGLGAWPLGDGMGTVAEKTVVDTVRTAIDSGVTLIDTAQFYRSSETRLGQALKDGYRQRCFLATKVSGDYSRAGIIAAMENSLTELGVDYVDLYQIHGWNPEYPIDESMETMARLQEQGKTRYIGVSNFNAEQMQQAAASAPFHSSQPRYNIIDRQIEAEDIPYCERVGIGILAHSPLAKGLLSGRYKPDDTFAADDERSERERFKGETFARFLAVAEGCKEVADAKGITLVQLAIAWILHSPAITCVLVGAKNPDQARDHLGAVGVAFTDDELASIDAARATLPVETLNQYL
jgi:aryl-alcohol dehydrogenase-like predicted oxidoreductase